MELLDGLLVCRREPAVPVLHERRFGLVERAQGDLREFLRITGLVAAAREACSSEIPAKAHCRERVVDGFILPQHV